MELMSARDYRDMVAWQIRHRTERLPIKSALACKLLEEAIELCYATGATTDAIMHTVREETTKAQNRQEDLGIYNADASFLEFGDVSVCLGVFAYHAQIKPDLACSAAMYRIQSRTWEADDLGVLRRPR